jgi:hypothetical protein
MTWLTSSPCVTAVSGWRGPGLAGGAGRPGPGCGRRGRAVISSCRAFCPRGAPWSCSRMGFPRAAGRARQRTAAAAQGWPRCRCTAAAEATRRSRPAPPPAGTGPVRSPSASGRPRRCAAAGRQPGRADAPAARYCVFPSRGASQWPWTHVPGTAHSAATRRRGYARSILPAPHQQSCTAAGTDHRLAPAPGMSPPGAEAGCQASGRVSRSWLGRGGRGAGAGS